MSAGVLVLRSSKDGTQFLLAAVKPPPGTIGVAPPPRPLCVAPCEAPVATGTFEVETDGAGQVGGSRRITLSPGERRLLSVQPGSSTMRIGGYALLGLGTLGTLVSVLGKENNGPLLGGSIIAALGGGGLVFFSRSEIKDEPAPKAAMFRLNGRF